MTVAERLMYDSKMRREWMTKRKESHILIPHKGERLPNVNYLQMWMTHERYINDSWTTHVCEWLMNVDEL